ncbi:MAG: hypothetical protein ACREQ7_21765 [Candidatus Binatia bacterium]
MKSSAATIRIQSVRVDFSSGVESLNRFARSHFEERPTGALPQAGQTEIEARLEWIEAAPPKMSYAAIAPGKRRPDRDIEIGANEIAWSRIDNFSDLRLRFVFGERRLQVIGQHFFSLSRVPLRDRIKKAWHRKRLPALRRKRFSTIIYYMVYYPSFWYLERRGLFPLHAAAVEVAGTGVVLCGLPGCGKSTLSLALLGLPGSRLLSDNIIFYGKERVFRCPEPVLLDDRSLDLIGSPTSLLRPLGQRHVYDRSWFHPVPERVADEAIPRLFFFVGLGHKPSLRALTAQEAYQRFASVNWIAQEVRRYLVYRSVLGLSTTGHLNSSNGEEPALEALLRKGQSYELTVGWGDGCGPAVEQIHDLCSSMRT